MVKQPAVGILESKDLKIGNWVNCHHPSNPFCFVKVTAGLLSLIEKIENGCIKEDSPLYRTVEPVLFTAEIFDSLKKDLPSDHTFNYVEEEHCIYIDNICRIQYVHVLQNFLELTNCSIEIQIH